MVKEIYLRKDFLIGQKIETIYFGGGTPSTLTIAELNLLFDALYKNFDLSNLAEVTFEANPDDITEAYLLQLKTTPINRFSLGVQSFFNSDLKWMNRAHNADQAQSSIQLIKDAGYKNITIDLIYGSPDLTLKNWEYNLDKFFGFGINHLSSYCLTVEPKTALDKFIKEKKFNSINEELAEAHFKMLLEKTNLNGFNQYEISNFGKPGHYALHNTNYWLQKSYLGIGPSAHSYNGDFRSWNIANNNNYVKALNNNLTFTEEEKLTTENKFNEYVMTALRTEWGIDKDFILNHFGALFLTNLEKNTERYISSGLIENELNTYKLTKEGKFLADGIASALFVI